MASVPLRRESTATNTSMTSIGTPGLIIKKPKEGRVVSSRGLVRHCMRVRGRESEMGRVWAAAAPGTAPRRMAGGLFCPARLRFFYFFSSVSLFCSGVSADQIFSTTVGMQLGRSSREPKYTIEFHSADSPFHADNGQEPLVMSNKKGQKYLCYLPVVEETKSVKPIIQQNISNVIVEGDKRIKLRTPDELMEVLKERCIYRHEGWWSYELCYQKKLKQFHLEDEKIIQEFTLGEFDPEATAAFNQNHSDISTLKDPRSKDASQRYHAHLFTNGTTCDLTNQPREAEIRFVCGDPTVMMSSIKEVSTCKYAVTVQCPLICRHPMFQQERPAWHTIHCNEMPQDKQEADMESLEGKQITIITDFADRFAT